VQGEILRVPCGVAQKQRRNIRARRTQLYPAGAKTHWEDVRIGAEKRANTHILRQLGALRRRKNRVGLS
jgi:hypothetical protein